MQEERTPQSTKLRTVPCASERKVLRVKLPSLTVLFKFLAFQGKMAPPSCLPGTSENQSDKAETMWQQVGKRAALPTSLLRRPVDFITCVISLCDMTFICAMLSRPLQWTQCISCALLPHTTISTERRRTLTAVRVGYTCSF